MTSGADRCYMLRALAMARLGLGQASPNPSVGCVLVKGGQIIGEAFHEYAGKDHAEVRAIRQAGRRTRGATAYVSLEPCPHYGRTPPCTKLLLEAGIRRVVVSALDPNPRVCGTGIEQLRAGGIRVDIGLMQEVAERIIEPFACHVRTGRPLVVAKVGMSLDGRIAAPDNRNHWLSSEEARSFGQSLRHEMDAILVGVGTILDDNPLLTYRGADPKARALIRVILDSSLRTPAASNIFKANPPAPIVVFCSHDAPPSRKKRLEHKGAEVVSVRRTRGGLDLKSILENLGRRNVLGLLVEGGSTIHWSFISAGLVDKFYFDVAPLVLGGSKSIPAVGGKGYNTIPAAPRFKIVRHFEAGPDLILETYPRTSRSLLSPWRSVPDHAKS